MSIHLNTPEVTHRQAMPSEINVDREVLLSLLDEQDAEKLQEILDSDPTIKNRVTWTHELNGIGAIKEKITSMQLSSTRYGIRSRGELIGYIGFWEDTGYMDGIPKKGEYGFGYFIAPKSRGAGVSTRAAMKIMEEAEKILPVQRYAIYIEDDNQSSQAVAEKLGLSRTDKVYVEPVMKTLERRWEKVISHE